MKPSNPNPPPSDTAAAAVAAAAATATSPRTASPSTTSPAFISPFSSTPHFTRITPSATSVLVAMQNGDRCGPTDADYQLRGLYDVEVDQESPSTSLQHGAPTSAASRTWPPNTHWISGWARLVPTDEYPLIEERMSESTVRFYFCPHGDPIAGLHFRRQAQVKALDTIPYTLKQPSGGSSPAPDANTVPRRFRPPASVLAWWEDDLGLWFVIDGPSNKTTPFLDMWYDVVGSGWPERAYPEMPSRWAEVCDLLLQAVVCIQALHDRHISLNWCHPSCFAVLSNRVVVNRLWDATALPGLQLSTMLPPSLASSPLFTGRDTIHSSTCNLSEAYVFRHLRYLAPEAAISRRVTPSNDIYGWGVFAYELITGTTIDGGPDTTDLSDMDLLADIHRHVTTEIVPPENFISDTIPNAALPPKQLLDIIMRALAKDPEDRYHNLDSLAYDLRKLSQVCRVDGDLTKFTPGEVDHISRFTLPQTVIEREHEMEQLDAAFESVSQGVASCRVVSVWGGTGNGKTRLVDEWAMNLEVSDRGSRCLVGRARTEEHVRRPLTSFVQIFQSLLDRVLTDPREDAKVWLERIRTAIGSQWQLFVSLLSQESRRLVGEEVANRPPTVDRDSFLMGFRSFSRRFLQLFASDRRPLILTIDNTQWLAEDELDTWRLTLDGDQSINHVLVLAITRGDGLECVSATQLSAAATPLHVKRLTEEGVMAYINTCLNSRVTSQGEAIASFLFGETSGSPVFLRTLMTTLVKEEVVAFDYDRLQWRFDLVALQSHLSDAGFDAYLESLMRRLPFEVQELLVLLANLPAAGFPLTLLAQAQGTTEAEAENYVQIAAASGAVAIRDGMVSFSHDRQRIAAQRLIPECNTAEMHQRVFKFLSHPDRIGDDLFEAVEHAMTARDLGTKVTSDEQLVSLLLDAAQRAAAATNFSTASHLVSQAESVMDETGGIMGWIERNRTHCFRFVTLATDVSTTVQNHQVAFERLELLKPHCKTTIENLTIVTLEVKQLIAEDEHIAAVDAVYTALDQFGYNPYNPAAVELWEPKSADEIEEYGREMIGHFGDADDEMVLIMSLITYAGSTIYVTEPEERRAAVFRLGLSVAKAYNRFHESAAYILAVHAITGSAVPSIQHAAFQLSRKIVGLGTPSLLTNTALIAIVGNAHLFMPLTEVADLMDTAFEASIGLANYDVASYIAALDTGTRLFSKAAPAWDLVSQRYEIIKPYATLAHTTLLNLLIQWSECVARPNRDRPWELDGAFFGLQDLEMIRDVPAHAGVYDLMYLSLTLLFGAPVEEVEAAKAAAQRTMNATEGLIFGTEVVWMLALAALRTGTDLDLFESAKVYFKGYAPYSSDMRARLEVLNALDLLQRDHFQAIPVVEKTITELDNDSQFQLSALLNFFVADVLLRRTGSQKLAAGFVRASFMGYKQTEAFGVCEFLRKRFDPGSSITLNPRGPAEFFAMDNPPQPAMRRMSFSASSEVITTAVLKDDQSASFSETPLSATPDVNSNALSKHHHTLRNGATNGITNNLTSLDTLALMRSSLALAEEKDSLALLSTLLRILCQFTRCDYAAIGLNDEEDKSKLLLKAAGPFQRIVSYDLDVSDDAAQLVCPASIMLHVARTGNPIIKPIKLSRLRNDPFYNGRQPRTLLCLPIINQGQQAGVILLLSMNSASATVEPESAREVVSTLATFVYIINSHQAFARSLKAKVEQRTRELSAALQAKTQFLSQCSHELRSPLAAIMGLAAVLEASPGMTPVQQEHIQTIKASGQDLLALISNILDHSKLESNSVLLEHIPFSIRDFVEPALDTIAPVAQSKNVELTVVSMFQNDPPGLLGDPFRVKQVLLNLLSNAVKFTPPGEKGRRTARVTCERTWEELDGNRVKVTLAIKDTGVGIPSAKLHKLFKSFSQVDESITRSYGGSGLGLVISRDLARLLGGDCTVESEFGKGSKFTFTFVADRDPAWKPVKLRTFATPQKCFILHPPSMIWGRLLEEDIKQFNCEPTAFTADPRLAVEKDHPNGLNSGVFYAFCLLDVSGIDLELLEQMKKLQPNAKFLYVARATEIAPEMGRLQITRESILARPLKFKSLYEGLLPPGAGEPQKKKITTKPAIDNTLAKRMPLQVLVVDDSAVNVSVCRRILELYGYFDVDAASDGLQATEMAEKTRYDLILLDLQMPVLDGFGALERIKNSPLAGDPCCVSLSANVDKSTQQRCLAVGFFGVLSKPVDIPRLGTILHKVYHHRHQEPDTDDEAEGDADSPKSGPSSTASPTNTTTPTATTSATSNANSTPASSGS